MTILTEMSQIKVRRVTINIFSDQKPGDEEEGRQMVNGTGKHKPVKPSNKKEKSVLQGKLTRLAIQIGYFGTVAAVLTILVLIIKFCVSKFMFGEHQCKLTVGEGLYKFSVFHE